MSIETVKVEKAFRIFMDENHGVKIPKLIYQGMRVLEFRRRGVKQYEVKLEGDKAKYVILNHIDTFVMEK